MEYPLRLRGKIMGLIIAVLAFGCVAVCAITGSSVIAMYLPWSVLLMVLFVLIGLAGLCQMFGKSLGIEGENIVDTNYFLFKNSVSFHQITRLAYYINGGGKGGLYPELWIYYTDPRGRQQQFAVSTYNYEWSVLKDIASRITAANPSAKLDHNVTVRSPILWPTPAPQTVDDMDAWVGRLDQG